jgi:hypothetical protein
MEKGAQRAVWLSFPQRRAAEQRRAAGARSFGGFVVLPEWLVGGTAYEIRVTEIPEGVLAVSAWLQEAEHGVPIHGTARFYTEGVALDARHGTLRVLGHHDFAAWPLPAGILLFLHW